MRHKITFEGDLNSRIGKIKLPDGEDKISWYEQEKEVDPDDERERQDYEERNKCTHNP